MRLYTALALIHTDVMVETMKSGTKLAIMPLMGYWPNVALNCRKAVYSLTLTCKGSLPNGSMIGYRISRKGMTVMKVVAVFQAVVARVIFQEKCAIIQVTMAILKVMARVIQVKALIPSLARQTGMS